YLTPHTFRGQENSTKYIVFVAKEIANLKNMPYDSICIRTSENARKFFNISN
ncbi:TatD family hydrolase, partial [bacterium]|nr:TatD family hydrolase [bacterium]